MTLIRLKTTASLALAIILVGCASPARIDQMSLGAREVSTIKVAEPMRSNVAIRAVTGGKDTNPLWVSNVGSADFERALEASLKAVGLLAADRQSGRYQVTAHLANLEQPLLGFDMTVTSTVNYVVSERATGKEVYKRSVVVPYTAKMGDAFVGTERLKLANEGAMRASITTFISDLQQVKLAELSIR